MASHHRQVRPQARERCAQLVAGVLHETLLLGARQGEGVEHLAERGTEPADLVAAGARHLDVETAGRARRPRPPSSGGAPVRSPCRRSTSPSPPRPATPGPPERACACERRRARHRPRRATVAICTAPIPPPADRVHPVVRRRRTMWSPTRPMRGRPMSSFAESVTGTSPANDRHRWSPRPRRGAGRSRRRGCHASGTS